jgi:hypothetical protein
MKWRWSGLTTLVAACGLINFAHGQQAQSTASSPGISNEANAAIQQMGKTLSQQNVSVKVQTLRMYPDASGDFLHIAHVINIVARRPDRMAITATGDDGTTKLVYDGKQISIADVDDKKYSQIPLTGDLDKMLEETSERMGIDFPLADLLTRDPAKSFFSGVTSGKEVGTVKIDGAPARHLYFTQTGATELELWLDKERAVPRRLIITYRAMPGQPNFVAEFADWNFNNPNDAEFAFQPPAGAQKVELTKEGIARAGTTAAPPSSPNTGRK